MTELPQETLDWFGGDELQARVFYEKYALRDLDGTVVELTPEDMWKRIAEGLAGVEETEELRALWRERFLWLLSDFRFIPGGRIMHAIGNPRKVTPFNCFVIPIKGDSLEAIFECAKEMARTYSFGGGVGVDISGLRPVGSPVRNAAQTSTGAVSFMELYSLVTGTIGQHGRRGALMITIADNHPDIFAFIEIKNDPERRRVRFANISVRVSDELMEAVRRDGKYELRFDGEYFTVCRTVDAREVWEKLVQNAWSSAEPGCLFWSTIKRYGTSEYNGMEVISTNPCVTGDTRVSTSEGLIPIAELAGRQRFPKAVLDSRVAYGIPYGCIVKVWRSGRKPVYRIMTRAGYELRATEDHKVLTANRGWVPVKDLRRGDLLLVQNRKGGFGLYGDEHLGRLLGQSVADGRAILGFYGDDRAFAPMPAERVAAALLKGPDHPAPRVTPFSNQEGLQADGPCPLKARQRNNFDPERKQKVPEAIWKGSEGMVRGFLQALFTADGAIFNPPGGGWGVRLSSKDLCFLRDIQLLLLNFGIFSHIYPKGRGRRCLHRQKAYHELHIVKGSLWRFYTEVGFLPGSEGQKRLGRLLKNHQRSLHAEPFLTPVTAIVPDGVTDVYDLTETISHTFIANGLTVSNCSEEPLSPYGNCNLGNINLSKFVLDEFTEGARVDWERLERAVRYAVRFLDDVITYAEREKRFPLSQQEERAKLERRVGVGFTGLGDMLVQLRLKYDTDDALEFVDELFHKVKCFAYDESVNLAIERGPFPNFDPEKHLETGFIRERLPQELKERIRRHGIRNVCVLTVPPVGSGAALAGVTSGIEPIFALSYIRRSESLSKEMFRVYHPSVRRYIERFKVEDERDLPQFFVTAHQIAPEMRVRMQATIQAHIDQAISSCLTRSNLILTDKGPRYIDTLCPQRREGEFVPLNGLKVANEKGLVKASDFYYNGVRPVYRVTLEGGYMIEGTGNHRVLVVTGEHGLIWRRLDELREGELVVLRKGMEVWGDMEELSEIYGRPFHYEDPTPHPIRIPQRITKDLALFLGYLVSGRSLLKDDETLIFIPQREEIIDDFCGLVGRVFGVCPEVSSKDSCTEDLSSVCIRSRLLVRFLDYLGVAFEDSEKRTPLCILSAGRGIVKEFLRGLALGGHGCSLPDEHDRLTLLCDRSERLVREVQQLLLNFGIESDVVSEPYSVGDPGHGSLYGQEGDALYDLSLVGEDTHRFIELIGSTESQRGKGAKGLSRAAQKVAGVLPFPLAPTYTLKGVRSVTLLSEPQETFDLSVPEGHHYIANGIVSHNTVNLPREISPQEVERIYFLAWRLGCKGITVYREGSREGVLITETFATRQQRGRLMPKPRPMMMVGKTYKLRTEMGNVYITVNADKEGPQEVFVRLGKSGSSAMAFTEAIGRLISLALRAGVSPDAIVEQLSGIKSSMATRQDNGLVIFSVPDAVAKALEMFLKGEDMGKNRPVLEALTENFAPFEEAVPPIPSLREELPRILQANGARYSGELCPNCGEPLIHSGGCELCLFCGYSRCQ